MGNSSKKSRLNRFLFLIAFTVLIFEGGSYLAILLLNNTPLTRSLFYQMPVATQVEYKEYLRRRDPRLGWPPPEQIGGEKYDASGSRLTPSFPDPGAECVSLYGDSFTYGSDVDHEQAWSNKLSQMLGCRVANFGVGGYGTDQAYLRFEGNVADAAEISILGVFPTNVIRNLTRNAYFVFGAFPTSFKPRFSYIEGELKLLPMPNVPAERLDEYLQSPEKFLKDDMLMPGTRYGPTLVKFPYSLTLVRTAFHPRVVSWLRGRPSWIDYLSPGHPSTGHEVLVGIVDKFVNLCETRNKKCMVLLFSTPASYKYFQDQEISAFSEITKVLEARGIAHLDLAKEIADRYENQSYCDFIAAPDACVGHFNPHGNKMLAEIMHDYLIKKAWVNLRQTQHKSR